MRKTVVLMLSMLFALSFPLLTMAMEDPAGAPADEQEAISQMDMHGADPSSCMEHMRHGRGMEGRRGEFGRRGGRFLMGCRFPKFYLKHAKDLKLSDEQVASLKKISFESRKEMITKVADVRVKRLELKEVLEKPDYKLEDATAKLKEIEDARLALESSAIQHSIQARDVLTPDQLKKARELCESDRACKSCGKGACGKGSCGKGMKRHMGPQKG